MTRMTKELSLVLVGSGILTAGYFLVPSNESEMEAKAEEQAAKRTGHTNYHHGHGGMGMLLFLHSPMYSGGAAGGRPGAVASSTRASGFGAMGRSYSAGS